MLTCDTVWPLYICLRNQEKASLTILNPSILVIFWGQQKDHNLVRLISETWQVYSTDSLKKSSSKAIPRSQTKVTFFPNPIGFPFLTKEVFCLWTLNVFRYQSGRRFELIGGLGGWRQATQSQEGSLGAEINLMKKLLCPMTCGWTTWGPGLIPLTGECYKVLVGTVCQSKLSGSTTHVSGVKVASIGLKKRESSHVRLAR